jgi:hypothetical protein
MSTEMSPDLLFKIACLAGVAYLIYVFIKDRTGGKK